MKQKLFLTSPAHDVLPEHSFNGIDLFKFIGAILICCIHIEPFQTTLWGLDQFNFYIQQYICRTAVPFFFVASGFLLFRKMEPHNINTDKIKSYSLRLLRLLGIWVLLLFQGGDGHLWYLHAVVVAVILVGFLLKKGMKLGSVLAVSLVLFLIGLFGDTYHSFLTPLLSHSLPKLLIVTFDNIIPSTRNGLFFGFFFVAMGALFAQKRIVMPAPAAFTGLLASLVLLFFEVRWLRGSAALTQYNLLISLIPTEFFAFYIATHLNLKDRPLYKTLRVVGLMLYLGHLFVDHFVWVALSLVKKAAGLNLMALELALTLGLTIALGYVILKLSETKKFQWLKYLYS